MIKNSIPELTSGFEAGPVFAGLPASTVELGRVVLGLSIEEVSVAETTQGSKDDGWKDGGSGWAGWS